MKSVKNIRNNNDNEELTEANEIQEESGLESFVKKNRNYLIGAVVIIALIAISAVFLFKSSTEKSEEASLKLSRVLPYYEQEQFMNALNGDKTRKMRGEAIVGLVKIVDDYEGTDAGKLAALYAGNCYLNLNKAKESVKYFEIASGSNSFIVMEGANAGLGKAEELQGKLKEASSSYEKAAEYAGEDEVKARYYLYSALCYEKGKDKENAIKFFQEVVNLSPQSEFSDMAKAGLTRLGIIID